jgi:hypothetical protein
MRHRGRAKCRHGHQEQPVREPLPEAAPCSERIVIVDWVIIAREMGKPHKLVVSYDVSPSSKCLADYEIVCKKLRLFVGGRNSYLHLAEPSA